jgi:hypothetical protein
MLTMALVGQREGPQKYRWHSMGWSGALLCLDLLPMCVCLLLQSCRMSFWVLWGFVVICLLAVMLAFS